MELRQREIDIETSQFQMVRTKALTEFRGDMQLSVGLTGDNEQLGKIYENPTQSPRVSLSFNIPIFDHVSLKRVLAVLRDDSEHCLKS